MSSKTEDDTFKALSRPPTEDEIEFGRGRWIYCDQHMAAHMTGWCTVSNRNKTQLNATDIEDAFRECRARGLNLYSDKK